MSDQAQQDVTDYDQLFPGRFLKAGQLLGKARTVTIQRVFREKLVGGARGEEKRSILAFRETDMQLVLCSTNGQCLRAMFGTHVPDWIGKRVTFYPAPETERGGENWFGRSSAIRVKGSPDIAQPITIEIQMPQRKPRQRTLEVTR